MGTLSGKGGGSAELAQGSSGDPTRLDEALAAARASLS
jgi:alanyl-tRNA synthetase